VSFNPTSGYNPPERDPAAHLGQWPAAGILRLLQALESPLAFERQEAWANMNEVLDQYRAGRASYADYLEAFDAFEQAAKAEREAEA
jgi:hypothetical protein